MMLGLDHSTRLAFRDSMKQATLDPFHSYKNAIDDQLADAAAVLDAFHVVKLGPAAVDACRLVPQDTQDHRGCKGDPLYPRDPVRPLRSAYAEAKS